MTKQMCSTVVLLAVGLSAVPFANRQDADEEFILFTSDRANPSSAGQCGDCEDIYVMAPEGELLPDSPDPIRLTFGGADRADPPYNNGGADWSDKQKLIAFQSNRLEATPQIFVMNGDGSNPQLLVELTGGAAFPSFSPNGNRICFHGQATPRDIYVMNLQGRGVTNLTRREQVAGEPAVEAGDNIRCDWSPKNNRIAFTSNRDTLPGAAANQEIYVMDSDGSNLVRLTNALRSDANPAWSPQGDRIAFESNRTGRPEIWVMDADGSNQERLTNFDAAVTPRLIAVTKPTWSPSGDRISFHRRVGVAPLPGHFEVYTMNADGSDIQQITSTIDPGFSGFPSWGKSSIR